MNNSAKPMKNIENKEFIWPELKVKLSSIKYREMITGKKNTTIIKVLIIVFLLFSINSLISYSLILGGSGKLIQ